EETLEAFTEGRTPTREELAASLTAPMPNTLEELRRHPLARWTEREFGIELEEGGRLRRRVPRTVTDAVTTLAEQTGASAAQGGHDYFHVRQPRASTRLEAHPVGTNLEDDADAGYLMLAPLENDWSDALIPDEWRDARGRLTKTWRDRVPSAVWVTPDGDRST